MKRTIYIPGIERHVTLRQYVQAVRTAKANPDATFPHTFNQWWPGTGRDIMAEFREGLQSRINQAIPYLQRGQV